MSAKQTEWTMSRLHEFGIRSPYDIATKAGQPSLFVVYHPQRSAATPAKWVIKAIDFDTDPKAPWYNYGCKTFYPEHPLTKENKDAAGHKALAWASKQYGVGKWERSPFGSYHPKGTLAAL